MSGEPGHSPHFLCGKMAAGKSTLARQLAATADAYLFVEDEWLAALYPDEIRDLEDYVKYSTRVRSAIKPQIVRLLAGNQAVVLDFPANTPNQRRWFREIIDLTGVGHVLHFVDVPDAICKAQLRTRSAALPAGSRFTTDAEFDAVTAWFVPPADHEGFNVRRHSRAEVDLRDTRATGDRSRANQERPC